MERVDDIGFGGVRSALCFGVLPSSFSLDLGLGSEIAPKSLLPEPARGLEAFELFPLLFRFVFSWRFCGGSGGGVEVGMLTFSRIHKYTFKRSTYLEPSLVSQGRQASAVLGFG